MNIHEALLRKRQMNSNITQAIQKEISSFENDTGLNVREIDVNFLEQANIGEDPINIFSGISIKVSI